MVQNLCSENVWLDKCKYDEAERVYYESKAKKEVQTPLAAEVGKAREWLTNIKKCIEEPTQQSYGGELTHTLATLEAQVASFSKVFSSIETKLNDLIDRVKNLETHVNVQSDGSVCNVKKSVSEEKKSVSEEKKSVSEEKKSVSEEKKEDDDVDLFGSESEEDEEAVEIREKRLAAYAAKKSKKPVLIAKSNIILDIKPWDDETDMKEMETLVRAVTTEGLIWGASKLVPLAYGIHKLQISCVVEDDIVSVDWLQEQIELIEDFVQSVDIAAFNKV